MDSILSLSHSILTIILLQKLCNLFLSIKYFHIVYKLTFFLKKKKMYAQTHIRTKSDQSKTIFYCKNPIRRNAE